MTPINLLNEVVSKKTEQDVANVLGLHPNTIARWFQKGEVPEHYNGDFKRMLGKKGDPDDQFYTNPDIARRCYGALKRIAVELGIDLSHYWFIEPSAGSGNFYDLLPHNGRIGLDLHPRHNEIREADYLLYTPPQNRKYVVIGNPPFGLRGHLALQFINHSFPFADIVAFILPQLFESDGKGVPAKRVNKGFKLAYSKKIPTDSFHKPDGTEVGISTVFQVWTKINHDKVKLQPRKTCKTFIKIYSLSDGGTPESTRNKNMIGKCDIYLPSTCFQGMQSYERFNDLPNQRGYGIVINRDKVAIKRIIRNNDWVMTAFLSTNGALNLRSSLIEDVITAEGYYDRGLL